MNRMKQYRTQLVVPVQIEAVTWLHWFQRGVFLTVTRGNENIYGTDLFGYEYYAKVY